MLPQKFHVDHFDFTYKDAGTTIFKQKMQHFLKLSRFYGEFIENECTNNGKIASKQCDLWIGQTIALKDTFERLLHTHPIIHMAHNNQSNKVAKIRNRYNQVPHLTQDTNGKVTNSRKTPQTRAKRSALSQQVTTKHI